MTGRDVVVTVPRKLWSEWLAEGDLAPVDGTPSRRGWAEYGFLLGGQPPSSVPSRVYVVAGGRLRGYAPLLRIERWPATGRFGARRGQYAFVRSGDAVAMSLVGLGLAHVSLYPYATRVTSGNGFEATAAGRATYEALA